MKDQRGVVYLETLIGVLPVFLFFFGTLQLADLSMAHLAVEHAATAAARAAVVVLPDDGAYYEDPENSSLNKFVDLRQADIELAADIILSSNPRLDKSWGNVSLDKETYSERDPLTALVQAPYKCLVPLFCPGGLTLTARATLIYQGAKFEYSPDTSWASSAVARAVRPERGPPQDRKTQPPAAGNKRDRGGDGDPNDRSEHGDDGKVATGDKGGKPSADKPADDGKGGKGGNPSGDEPGADPTRPGTGDDAEKVATGPRPTPPPSGPVTPDGRKLLPVTNPTCFVAGTLVHTPRGELPIESIAAGDAVYAYDTERAQLSVSRVARIYERQTQALVELSLLYPDANAATPLLGTPDHPFYLPTLGRYVRMGELATGDVLQSDSGAGALVLAASPRSEARTVYNFEVESRHNYFVAPAGTHAPGVLVHNADYKDINDARLRQVGNTISPDQSQRLRDFLDRTYPDQGERAPVVHTIADAAAHPRISGVGDWVDFSLRGHSADPNSTRRQAQDDLNELRVALGIVNDDPGAHVVVGNDAHAPTRPGTNDPLKSFDLVVTTHGERHNVEVETVQRGETSSRNFGDAINHAADKIIRDPNVRASDHTSGDVDAAVVVTWPQAPQSRGRGQTLVTDPNGDQTLVVQQPNGAPAREIPQGNLFDDYVAVLNNQSSKAPPAGAANVDSLTVYDRNGAPVYRYSKDGSGVWTRQRLR